MTLKFAYQYPEPEGTEVDMLEAGALADVAATAEAAGWHGFALTEHPAPGANWLSAGGHQTIDPFVGLGHVAAATRHLRLLTYLSVAPYRNPNLLAKAAASVDLVSNGRLILGLGVGYLKSEFRALGVDFEERNALFDEALDVLPQHWSGEPFSYQGLHFSAREVIGRPRPIQRPIPIWIGGNSTRTLRRVATRAQGWMPLATAADISATTRTPHLSSVADLARRIRHLQDLAGERGPTLDVAVPYHDVTIAEPDRDVERHRNALGELEEAGATWIVVSGTTSTLSATTEFVEAFASNYIGNTAR